MRRLIRSLVFKFYLGHIDITTRINLLLICVAYIMFTRRLSR
jgi:hypothetical protein